MDGRYTELAVLPVVAVTDATSDISALAYRSDAELRKLHAAHKGFARCTHVDWGRYLNGLAELHSINLAVGEVARRLAGAVEEAPRLSPDQLELAFPVERRLRVVA